VIDVKAGGTVDGVIAALNKILDILHSQLSAPATPGSAMKQTFSNIGHGGDHP
jgi:hypothetical protein